MSAKHTERLRRRRSEVDVLQVLGDRFQDQNGNALKSLIALLSKVSEEPAKLWGNEVIGFGRYRYFNQRGELLELYFVGLSARRAGITIYFPGPFWNEQIERRDALLQRLGEHRPGQSRIYVRSIADINLGVLNELVGSSIAAILVKFGRLLRSPYKRPLTSDMKEVVRHIPRKD